MTERGVWKRVRRSVRVLGALAVVVAVLAAGACGSEGNQSATVSTADVGEYASWWLNSAPSSVSTDLELTVQHGMCDEVGTVQIQESETTVVVDIRTPWTGKVGPNGEKGCSGAARTRADDDPAGRPARGPPPARLSSR